MQRIRTGHKLILLFVIMGFILTTVFVTNSFSQTSENQQIKSKESQSASIISLSVTTDRIKYVEGQSIRIYGSVYNVIGQPVDVPVSVKVKKYYLDDSVANKTRILPGKTVYQAVLLPKEGNYSTILNSGITEGEYNVTGFISSESARALNFTSSASATTDINVVNIFSTTPFLVLVIGGSVGIIGLVIITGIRQKPASNDVKNSTLHEMLQFIFLSILAFSPIAAFAFTDVALFPDSPVGIIIKPSVVASSENSTEIRGEWMLNIGGTSFDKYKSGIQVPLAILIFGIAGGYLRYLYSEAQGKLPELRKVKISKNAKQVNLDPANQHDVFYEILYNVILLVLSPLLAIAVWLVLWQGGTTSSFTLAAVSIVIGLVTREAVNGLIKFFTGIWGPLPNSRVPTETENDKPEEKNSKPKNNLANHKTSS